MVRKAENKSQRAEVAEETRGGTSTDAEALVDRPPYPAGEAACATVALAQLPIAGRQSSRRGVGTSRPQPRPGRVRLATEWVKEPRKAGSLPSAPPAPRHLGVVMIQSSDLQFRLGREKRP